MGTLAFEDSEVNSLLLLNRVFIVGTDQTGQYLDIEPDLRHAPLIINESGCNANTGTVSTPQEKLQDKFVLDGKKGSILQKEDATRDRSACMRLSITAQNRLDLAETFHSNVQRDIWLGNPKLHCDFEDKNTWTKSVFADSDCAGDPVSRKTPRDWRLRSITTP